MRNQHVGLLLIAVVLVFFFVVVSFNNALEEIVNTSCTHGDLCPMHTTVATQKAISYGLMGLLLIVGLAMTFFVREPRQESKTKARPKPKNLDDDEQKIIDLLRAHDGSMYQSDIIKESKLSKVKVSRTLDRLSGKGLLERHRRGMTNAVVLK